MVAFLQELPHIYMRESLLPQNKLLQRKVSSFLF
jgi:hypothetical protein